MAALRLLRHLLATRRQVRRYFSPGALAAVRAAIADAERLHGGEIRVAIEASLAPFTVMRGMTARERALEVFSELHVWDTQDNNGVLVYVLLADRAIEIIADRGIHGRAGDAAWERIARALQQAFAAGRGEAGLIECVAAVSCELARHFPSGVSRPNELPDDVKLL